MEAIRGETDRRLSIQLLRCVAALLVATTHIAQGFARHIAVQRDLPFSFVEVPLSRVAVFFLLSGCVMVVASARFYGTPGGWKAFLYRRMTRIMPSYWAATAILVAVHVFLGMHIDLAQLVLSLLLVPYWSDTAMGVRPLPILWPAWTLFFEVLFYFAFAAFLRWGQGGCVRMTSFFLSGLVAAGAILAVPFTNGFPVSWPAPLFMMTRPILLLLVVGMAGGVLIAKEYTMRPEWRITCLVLAIVFAAVQSRLPPQPMLGWGDTMRIGIPAMLVCIAVAAGPVKLPFARAVDVLGNLSYAIYLLHVPVAVFWIWFYQKAMPHPGPWGFFLSCLGVTLLASYIFYAVFERPVMQWCNRRAALRAGKFAVA